MRVSHIDGVVGTIAYADEFENYELTDKRFEVYYDGDHIMYEESSDGYPFYEQEHRGVYWMRSPTDTPGSYRFGPIEIKDLNELVPLPALYDRPYPYICVTDVDNEMIQETTRARLSAARRNDLSDHDAVVAVLKGAGIEKVKVEVKKVLVQLGCKWDNTNKRFCF